MNESFGGFPKRYRESLFSAISAGFFFLLVGIIFVITPNLLEAVLDFFRDFDIIRVPNTPIYLIAPTAPRVHQLVYTAVEQFSYALGLFQIAILALRFIAGSPTNKKAETTGNLVSSIGTGYLIRQLLIETTTWTPLTAWFVFWSAIIMLLGTSLIVRAIVQAAAASMRRPT